MKYLCEIVDILNNLTNQNSQNFQMIFNPFNNFNNISSQSFGKGPLELFNYLKKDNFSLATLEYVKNCQIELQMLKQLIEALNSSNIRVNEFSQLQEILRFFKNFSKVTENKNSFKENHSIFKQYENNNFMGNVFQANESSRRVSTENKNIFKVNKKKERDLYSCEDNKINENSNKDISINSNIISNNKNKIKEEDGKELLNNSFYSKFSKNENDLDNDLQLNEDSNGKEYKILGEEGINKENSNFI